MIQISLKRQPIFKEVNKTWPIAWKGGVGVGLKNNQNVNMVWKNPINNTDQRCYTWLTKQWRQLENF